MSTIPPSRLPPSFATPEPYDVPDSVEQEIERTTWYDFACVLLFLVGTFNIIDGIASIRDSRYVGHTTLFANLHAWGWFFLLWGILQIVASFAAYRGARWGLILAIVTAFFNAIAHLSAIKSAPIWSSMIIGIDVLVMYGLIVHGRPRGASSYRG
jgi:uncharacterized membrane protein HdeD (DUF308 family)